MSRNIVFEGWLTKSPPAKRIWRAKWRRRWFSLRQSGELPGQYFLDYYADRNCRRLKGTINLDLCEQVDAGLHMERGNGSLDPKIRGSVFTVRTQSRTYHLEADCEEDMEKWVDAICRVCGLRSTEDSGDVLGKYQNSIGSMSAMNEQYEFADRTGPYIRISECITGVRAQNSQRAFTFDPQNIVTSNRMFERDSGVHSQMYTSQPHIRFNAEFSENESNMSDEDCKSLNASQSHIGEWSVAKSFTKLAVSQKENGSADGPPEPPPRPPKTFSVNKDHVLKEAFQGPKIQEPDEDSISLQPEQFRHPRRLSHCNSPTSPGRRAATGSLRCTDDEEDLSPGHPSLQYFNMPSLPPAVDRALKPRHSSHSIGFIHNLLGNQNFDHLGNIHHEDIKPDVLQYLDLDLHSSKPVIATKHHVEVPKKKIDIVHGKSLSAVAHTASDAAADSAYKTVDFLKTEAFNITRQDAEASRNTHQ